MPSHPDNPTAAGRNEFFAPTLGECVGGQQHAVKMYDGAVEKLCPSTGSWMLEDLASLSPCKGPQDKDAPTAYSGSK